MSALGSGINLIFSNASYTVIIIFAAHLMGRLGISPTQYALIFTISSFSGMFVSLIAGQLVDKFGSRVMALFGGVCQIFMILSMVFAPNMAVIYIASVLLGFAGKFNGSMLHSMNVCLCVIKKQ